MTDHEKQIREALAEGSCLVTMPDLRALRPAQQPESEQEKELRRSLAEAQATISQRNAEVIELQKRIHRSQQATPDAIREHLEGIANRASTGAQFNAFKWIIDTAFESLDLLPAQQATPEPCKHVLYKTEDADKPREICDRNGEVVLGQCKVCGKAEAELDGPCTGQQPRGGEAVAWNSIQIASWIGSQLMHAPAMFERSVVCKFVRSLGRHPTLLKHSPIVTKPEPMTDDQVWHSDGIMSANGIAGFKFDALMRIVRAVEAHHGIAAQEKGDAHQPAKEQ